MKTNAINWFEIPVKDFNRAKTFYSKILGVQLSEMEMVPFKMGFFPYDQTNGVGGAIVQGEGYEPTTKGARIYLNGGDDLNVVLNRVDKSGGKVVLPKTEITPEFGFYATFEDTEGNHVSLHSMS